MSIKQKYQIGQNILAIIFLIPALILLVVFVYGPLVQAFGFAFTRFQGFAAVEFVGFRNFETAFQTPLFWNALRLTFIWVILNTTLPTLVGILLALLMEFFTKRKIFTGAVRTILFMPMMMALMAAGILWSLVYNPNIGIVAGVADALGYTGSIDVFGNASTAIFFAFIPVVWKDAGFSMVIFSAALQGLSKDIQEASVVEGASKMQQIRYIMLPSITPTIITVMLINMISGFRAFDMLHTMTRGGPGAATNVVAVYAYEMAFSSFRFDFASAMQVILFICVVAFILAFQLLVKPLRNKYAP